MDSETDASSNLQDGVSELLPPSGALVPAPVGAAPEHVRAWFDNAVKASEPFLDGTLASERDATDTYRRMDKAENTRRAYRAAVQIWCAWCARHDLPPLPASGQDIAAFLAGERRRKLSPETLKLRRAAIRYLHRAAGCPVPTDDVCVSERLAGSRTLRKHIAALEQSMTARAATAGGAKLRRFKDFYDCAGSWDRVERIIARVEAGPQGVDTRFIVTSLRRGSPRTVYQDIYCARGQAENHIKAWKTHLAADRTSCCRASANQMRLFLHVGAYWLMWGLRALMPRRSSWRVVQFDTLRLRLIKLAVRVEVLKRQVRLHLPQATPDQPIFAWVLTRMPRLIV